MKWGEQQSGFQLRKLWSYYSAGLDIQPATAAAYRQRDPTTWQPPPLVEKPFLARTIVMGQA